MKGFDEAWLVDHQRKGKATALVTTGPVQFTLSAPYALLNVLLRLHWHARGRYARKLMGEIAKLTAHRLPAVTLARARVEIVRHSVQEPDHDGLVGGAKPLIDCLLVRSDRHPFGLGFIADDNPACLDLVIRHEKATTLKAQCTVVRIEAV